MVGSSVNSNGWNVEVDHTSYFGAWVTVPSAATVGVSYEVRLGNNHGSGFFDVTASGSSATAPVMLPLTIATNPVVGGNPTTGTVTIDAPAPTGGATVSLACIYGSGSLPTSVTIPAGQTSATFTITTQATTDAIQSGILVSYNGVRTITLIITGTGGCNPPSAPLTLTATAASGQVTLQWSPPTSGSAPYNVYRSLTHGDPYTKIASNLLPTQYIDNNVTNGTTYYYVVTAVNVCGESGYSNEASATPIASTLVYSLTLNPTSVIGGQHFQRLYHLYRQQQRRAHE